MQDEANERNFILSGVLIYAAARIFGRKVDYLEQEIIGIRNNFEAVATSDEKQPEKEMKKSRSKKFLIKDRVNVEKQNFEEKPVQVLAKVDINKTLAQPSKIDRLLRMKEFFAKNKSRGGKLVIPKSLLFTNDNVVSNFGSTQIYEFDDNKDVVGSRRDFTSFSYFINSSTGELQSDLTVTGNNTNETDFDITDRENIPERMETPEIWGTPPSSPHRLISPSRPTSPAIYNPTEELDDTIEKHRTATDDPVTPLSINIDEGIEVDEATKATMLLSPLTVKLMDIVRKTPNLFPVDPQVNDSINIDEFGSSVLSVQHELRNKISDFDLPLQMISNVEPKMRNFLMIPLKKLKHKVIFDLPIEEYGELKRRKREQCKPTGADLAAKQARMFKPLDMTGNDLPTDSDDHPFLGFTREQQETPMSVLNYDKRTKLPCNQLKTADMMRKFSNDSGWLSGNETGNDSRDNIFDLTTLQASDEIMDSSKEPLESTIAATDTTAIPATINEGELEISRINLTGGDSCYHSCVSGDSSKTELSSFFRDIETRNSTIDESDEIVGDEHEEADSGERVLQMQQSAVNVRIYFFMPKAIELIYI